MDAPPPLEDAPDIRQNFLYRTEAQAILKDHPQWPAQLKGDLQMHTVWSDGTGTVAQMAEAAKIRGYEYISITDHAKALKIAGVLTKRASKSRPAKLIPQITTSRRREAISACCDQLN